MNFVLCLFDLKGLWLEYADKLALRVAHGAGIGQLSRAFQAADLMTAGSHDAINGVIVANDTGIGGSRGHGIHFLLVAARQGCICRTRNAAKITI